MKIKLGKVITVAELLMGIKTSNELVIKLAWSVDDILEVLQKHVERYNDERKKLIEANGTPGDEPGSYTVAKEKVDEVNKALNDLAEMEVELSKFKLIPKDELFEANIKLPKGASALVLKDFLS